MRLFSNETLSLIIPYQWIKSESLIVSNTDNDVRFHTNQFYWNQQNQIKASGAVNLFCFFQLNNSCYK